MDYQIKNRKEISMPLLLHVMYTTKENKRDEFYKLINQLEIPQKSRAEEDNCRYDYFIPYDTKNQIFLVLLRRNLESYRCFAPIILGLF